MVVGLCFLGGGYFFQFPLFNKIYYSDYPAIHSDWVTHLSTLRLTDSVDTIKVEKLSGLAWDNDNKILLAVSDNGYLFHFSLVIEGDELREVKPIAVFPLRDEKGNSLIGSKFSDAEGLSLSNANNGIKGDTQLWISFEQKMRVVNYTTEGVWRGNVALPMVLARSSNYKEYNSGLEALTLHPKYGLLVAPEYNLKSEAEEKRVIYAVGTNKRWQFRTLPYQSSGLVAMEALSSGGVLLLERSWVFPFNRAVIALRMVDLESCPHYEPCPIKSSFVMDAQDGWYIDNFEGLAQVNDNHFLIVSDNNGMLFQSTLFMLLTINPG